MLRVSGLGGWFEGFLFRVQDLSVRGRTKTLGESSYFSKTFTSHGQLASGGTATRIANVG